MKSPICTFFKKNPKKDADQGTICQQNGNNVENGTIASLQSILKIWRSKRDRSAGMKPAPFSYHAPKTLAEAVSILADVAPDDGRVLAGGQSLVPTMAFRLARPAHLVDINRVAGLDRLAVEDGALAIGARVRHAAFHDPVEDGVLGRLMSTVVRHIAHLPIRARGTLCGSLAHADPASEWALVAVTLEASMSAKSANGDRGVAASDFFAGIMTTSLGPDELLAETRFPVLPADTRFGFEEFSRRAGDFAIAMVLATYRVADGVMTDVRIGVGGAEETPRRMTEAEGALDGRAPVSAAFEAAASAAADAVDPMEDVNTSAGFRRDLVRALTRRALEGAA